MSVRIKTLAATIAEAYSEVDVLLRERHYSTDSEQRDELALRAARNALLTAHACLSGILKEEKSTASSSLALLNAAHG